jgi:hypothetical protein
MSLKQILGKKLLVDTGNENEIFNTEHIVGLADGTQLKFTTRELIDLADAEKKDNSLIHAILTLSPNIEKQEPIPTIFIYKNSDGLPVFIKRQSEYLLLIALGEFQYGRYKLYLEGVFENHPPNNFH